MYPYLGDPPIAAFRGAQGNGAGRETQHLAKPLSHMAVCNLYRVIASHFVNASLQIAICTKAKPWLPNPRETD